MKPGSRPRSAFFNSPRVHFARPCAGPRSQGPAGHGRGCDPGRAFIQPDRASAGETWAAHVADQMRPRWPKLGALLDDAEEDVLAYMTFPAQHRTKLPSTNPLERLNKEIKRRADVVGIAPSEDSITRLIGAVLLERDTTSGRSSTAPCRSRAWQSSTRRPSRKLHT